MKGYCLFLILLLATIMSAAQRAQDPTDTAQRIKGSTNTVQRAQISLETGYQSMDFRWSIAGNMNGTGPNVYSELIWKQVKGPALNAAVQWKLGKRLCLSGSYNHVFTQSGNVSDKDYQADNRTEETYQGNFSSGRGYSEYWSAAIGYTIVDNRLVSLVPFIGYGASDQSLYLLDDSPETGALNSSYKAHWYGPLVKVRSTLHLTGRLGVGLDVVYHQVDYRAKADWNLIETFQHPVSFSHTARIWGQWEYPVELPVDTMGDCYSGSWLFRLANG